MERDIEKDLIEIECAIKSQEEKDNIFTMCVLQRCHKLVSQLKEYKDLEEQGKLLKLPYKVGDIVYTPIFDRMHDPQTYVSEAPIEDVSAKGAVFAGDFVKWEDFGKYEFFTREEAEAALKEL